MAINSQILETDILKNIRRKGTQITQDQLLEATNKDLHSVYSGAVTSTSDTNTISLDVSLTGELTSNLNYQDTSDITISEDASGLKSDLQTTGVVAGGYGSATLIPVLTIDSKGRITAASTSAISGFVPTSRLLTINGSAQNLSADRTWTITTTGTLNRISVSGGTGLTPTIDIDTNYVGQASITTLGTITTGTWNGSIVGLAYGGTNKNMTAVNGGIVWTDADSMEVTSAGSSGQIFRSAGAAAPTWSTATFPNTATTTGAYLRADGTNWITSTLILPNTATANRVVYATASNTYGESANLTFDGTGLSIGVASLATSTYPFQIIASANAGRLMAITNSTAGTAAYSALRVFADSGNSDFYMISYSSAFTTSGLAVANRSRLVSLSNAGLVVDTFNAVPLIFGSANTERIRILGAAGAGSLAGNTGFGVTNPTAIAHFKAGTTTAGSAPIKLTTQASGLTAVEQGAFELIGNSLQFTQLAKRRGAMMSQNVRTSTTTVENTITESSALITAEHGAGYLEVGKCEEIVLSGTIEQRNNASAVCTFRVKYAGTTVHSFSTTGSKTIATGTPYRLTVTTTCRSTGATGTMQINSFLSIAGETIIGGSTLQTIDTTTAQDTTVTAQWGEANASDILKVEQGHIKCIETNK